MLEELKKEVCEANLLLVKYGLVTLTWGNVSAIDRKSGLVVIKPSGVSYETMKSEDMVVVDLNGKVVDGRLKPSSDTPTHLELYRNFKDCGGIVHTHSSMATSFAQANREISALGTTHADSFYGPVRVTRPLTKEEIEGDYEAETGKVIVETLKGQDPMAVNAILVYSHGPFTWGGDAKKAVENALILEEVAKMNFNTLLLNPNVKPMQEELLDKHFFRKHGENAYYGQ